MVIAEDVGLYKFDILGQRGLAKIKESLEISHIIDADESDSFDIHDVKKFLKDPVINDLYKNGTMYGLFLCGIARHAHVAQKIGSR